jgi:tRNA(fMet)-specific endonuclease VapC
MLVLDTDIISLLQRGPIPVLAPLRERIRASGQPVWVTIVSLQEQLRGRLAQCSQAQTPEQYIIAARKLHETWADYRSRLILDFDERAAVEFRRLKAAKVRIGTMDLRIAAIALARQATLITRNLSDFRKVPGLPAQDWSAA